MSKPSQTATPHTEPLAPFALVPCPKDGWGRVESRKCYKEDESSTGVAWVDVGSTYHATRRKFTSLDELQQYDRQHRNNNFGLRVVSLNQDNSWKPLNVTRGMLSTIVDLTDAFPEFLDIISCFHRRNNPTEEGFCSAPFLRCSAEGMEIAYLFKYASHKGSIDNKDPWSIRQTGVYQRYHFATKSSTWIFLHPSRESAFQTRLEKYLDVPNQCSQLRAHPLLLHNLLFSTYLPAWRDFMVYYEDRVLTLYNTIMGTSIEEPLRISHETLTTVVFVESRYLALRTILDSTRKTLELVNNATNALFEAYALQKSERIGISQWLDNYLNLVDAYTHNVSFLHARASRTAQLITDTLSFKNALTARDQSKYMLVLTSSTAADSMTVRTITVVTLIYLPSTFMATVFGMRSFFTMDSTSHQLVVSRQFWIFVVCAVPLTFATVMCWWMRRKRREDFWKREDNFNGLKYGQET